MTKYQQKLTNARQIVRQGPFNLVSYTECM